MKERSKRSFFSFEEMGAHPGLQTLKKKVFLDTFLRGRKEKEGRDYRKRKKKIKRKSVVAGVRKEK